MANVTDNQAEHRFELATDDGIAFAAYTLDQPVVTFTHTIVPDELRGRGIGTRLVGGALAIVRDRDWHVVPRCPFVAAYMEEHPETRGLLAR